MSTVHGAGIKSPLRRHLDLNGWRVVRESNFGEWWIDEQWTIESERQAKGLQLYLSFLVDPLFEGTDVASAIWAVALSTRPLGDRLDVEARVAEIALQRGRLEDGAEAVVKAAGFYRNDQHNR